MKNNKKSKKPLQIAVIIGLLFLILFEGKVIFNHFSDLPEDKVGETVSAVGKILASEHIVKINNEEIPTYTVEGTNEIYFTDYDLGLIGFECTLSDGVYNLKIENPKQRLSSEKFISDITDTDAFNDDNKLKSDGKLFNVYKNDRVQLIPASACDSLGDKKAAEEFKRIYYAFGSAEEIQTVMEKAQEEIDSLTGNNVPTEEPAEPVDGPALEAETEAPSETTMPTEPTTAGGSSKIIVLDPGHGKSSALMTADEKTASGWVQNASGAWGEWRHYKVGSSTADCSGSGCNGRVTPNGACWYPIGNGDRATEPELNLANTLAAKKYLEAKGYTVRMTRTTNDENPSITRRLSYCYPGNDTSKTADAAAFVCVHSNAGGGRGSAYISAGGPYDQKGISSTYVEDSNRLGALCNENIVNYTSLNSCAGGAIGGLQALIAFCKSPVPCGYLEIGFFDSQSDLAILRSESDTIGKAIADGIDAFIKEKY